MLKTSFVCVCAATFAMAVGGCSQGVKKTLGLERNMPDEFAVVERAPLTLPPNYDLLPPEPGAARPQEAAPVKTARGLVLRSESDAPKAQAGLSSSENALLNKAGASAADPNIRANLSQTKDLNSDSKKPVIEKLGLRSSGPDGKALNATQEAARLKQQNIKSPQPVTTNSGQTSAN